MISTARDVAAEIKSRLQTIRLATPGMLTDIGRDVKMGKRKMPGDEDPPCIQVFEGPDDPQDQKGRQGLVLLDQTYVIDGYDVCDPDNPNDQAHKMLADIKRVIFAGEATFGGQVQKVTYRGRDIGPRPDGVALVQVRVEIGVSYVESLTNP